MTSLIRPAHNFTAGARNNTKAMILDNDRLRRLAPSVFATCPWGEVSPRYKFVPTIEVVDILRDKGFLPTYAGQSRSRIEGKGDFTRHVLRFRHESHFDIAVGDEIPELVLMNSHDRSSAYNFMAGIFRLVCSNGAIVQSSDMGSFSVRHQGKTDFHEQILEATYNVVEELPRAAKQIEEWKQIELAPPQRHAFAEAALIVKSGSEDKAKEAPIKPADLLSARRTEDRKGDLWTAFNVIQENLIKGGLRGRNPETGRRTTTRQVKSVAEDVRLNRALWSLTAKMAELAK